MYDVGLRIYDLCPDSYRDVIYDFSSIDQFNNNILA